MTRKEQWWEWHKQNRHVYELFEQFSFQAINRGHKRCSAWLIINRIRWETTIETNGGDFKISNDLDLLFENIDNIILIHPGLNEYI